MQQVQTAKFEIFDASTYRIGIVVAQFNRDICEGLLESAQQTLADYAVPVENITIVKVAGAVEIPVVLQKMAMSEKYDVLLVLGTIIRGETPHFDYVAQMTTDGVLRVQLDYTIPVGLGVLTTNNKEQANARMHVGGQAIEAALQTKKVLEIL